MELFVGELARLEGVKGKGTANSRGAFLVADLDGDLKGLGDVGVARMEEEEGDFGDEEASKRVSADGFVGLGKGGRSTIGIIGVGVPL
jgi:hypothetical protein